MNRTWVLLLVGFAVGVIGFAGWRFAGYRDSSVHYHANFALYINGARDKFRDASFYEEVQACSLEQSNDPHHRAHLHDNVNDVVHVHDSAVTWGDFFANLGYSVGPDLLRTRSRLYSNGPVGRVSYILNGSAVEDISGLVIKSEDRLLINFGKQTHHQLLREYSTVANTAHDYNETADPASCSGNTPSGWRARWHNVLN